MKGWVGGTRATSGAGNSGRRIPFVVLGIALSVLLIGAPGGRQRPVASASAQEPGAQIEAAIDELVAQMTLEEKLGQLSMLDADYATGELTDEQKEMVRNGTLGSTLNARGAKATNQAQRIAVQESRLGIPLIFGFDVIHGYRTVFPMPLAEASSWDVNAARRSAAIAAEEARAAGVTWTFAPMVDIARDARWGRVVEGAGEDPFLGSAFASARVEGFQGSDYSQPDRVAATAKHWVAYGGAEAGRDYNTVDTSERSLRELYFPPFEAAQRAGVDSFMTSFNEISGIPATANQFVLTDVLRDEWSEDGPVISDYTAVAELRVCPIANPEEDPGRGACGHGVAADGADAARLALNAGTDIEMVSQLYRTYIPELIDQGLVSMERVDEAVRRVLRLKFRAGLFDDPYVDATAEDEALLAPQHLRAARRIAARSMVLLKNENRTLPLSRRLRHVAVVGPLANNQVDMMGTWTGDGRSEDVVPVLRGVKAALGDNAQVTYAEGCDPECASSRGFRDAVRAARSAQITIAVVGEPAAWSGEASSRAHIDLPGRQLELLKAIRRTGKPFAVVVMNGRPLDLGWLHRQAPAVLEAWYPGTQAGHAVADVLFGRVNPGGKLPVTFPRAVGQVPLYYGQKPTGRPPNPDNKYTSQYLDVPVTPLYEFGYGLSYTGFEISDLQLSDSSISSERSITVRADVANTGARTGDEVVQLYIRDKVASVTRPVAELRGFRRVTLEPGEKKTVSFTLDGEDLAFWGQGNSWVVEPGEFDLWVGNTSAVTEYPAEEDDLHETFTVAG